MVARAFSPLREVGDGGDERKGGGEAAARRESG